MRKRILYPALVVIAVGGLLAMSGRNESAQAGKSWGLGRSLYPLRKVWALVGQTPDLVEVGTLHKADDGSWLLSYSKAKVDPLMGAKTDGIVFRVPTGLAEAVAAAGKKVVKVTIGREPDPDHLGCSTFVLTSLAPAE